MCWTVDTNRWLLRFACIGEGSFFFLFVSFWPCARFSDLCCWECAIRYCYCWDLFVVPTVWPCSWTPFDLVHLSTCNNVLALWCGNRSPHCSLLWCCRDWQSETRKGVRPASLGTGDHMVRSSVADHATLCALGLCKCRVVLALQSTSKYKMMQNV